MPGVERPPRHEVVEQQRFTLPEVGEVWTERWQAPAGVRVERIELNVRGLYVEVDNASSNYVCMSGDDVMWSGTAPWRWLAGECTGAMSTANVPTRNVP
ncbi:MAG: hypothetical protein IPG06_03480 [Haliea sp.]|nr:hypothetical protein [Haliea sp.]